MCYWFGHVAKYFAEHGSEWVLVGVTLLSALASTAVAIVAASSASASARTAGEALQLAQWSEANRLSEAARAEQSAYQQVFDKAMAGLFVAVHKHIASLEAAETDPGYLRGSLNALTGEPFTIDDLAEGRSEVRRALQLLSYVSSPSDHEVVGRIDMFVQSTLSFTPDNRIEALTHALSLIDSWRHSYHDKAELFTGLDDLFRGHYPFTTNPIQRAGKPRPA